MRSDQEGPGQDHGIKQGCQDHYRKVKIKNPDQNRQEDQGDLDLKQGQEKPDQSHPCKIVLRPQEVNLL